MHFCTVQTLAILIISFLWFLCATKKRQNKSSHLCLILLNAINDLSNSTYIITKQENKTSRVDKYSRSRGCPFFQHTTVYTITKCDFIKHVLDNFETRLSKYQHLKRFSISVIMPTYIQTLTTVWYEVAMHVHVEIYIYTCSGNLFERLAIEHQQKSTRRWFGVYETC